MTCPCGFFRSPDSSSTPDDEPCASSCGKCSTCIRAVAAWWNRKRYGQADYPGTGLTVDREMASL